MLLEQVPAARPNEQDGKLLLQLVFLAFRAREIDRASNRVAQIDLSFDHVPPRWRIRVLEVGHEHLRAGVQGVDDHLAIGRSGDLDASIAQIRRYGRTRPVALADLLRLRQEIEQLATIERGLTFLPARETLPTSRAE